jgi:glycerol-1-phosphate dehydrogenase [NAD(P)+]
VDVVLAIGGGPLHDIVRYCCRQQGIPFVSVPTAASCDAFSAEVAAMTWEGVKKTVNCQAPELVVADVDILCAAPPHLILSGIGDVLGKFIALAEWKIAHAITGEDLCEPIYDMMREALLRVWDNCLAARAGEAEAVAAVMHGLLLSGIAMQLFGSSRPASGAEHHISHLIDLRPEGLGPVRGASHGEQVAVGTVLASREYHRLAAFEDIADRVTPYKPVDDAWLRTYFGETLYPATAAENAKDALLDASPLAIVMAWEEIQNIVAGIPSANRSIASPQMQPRPNGNSLEEYFANTCPSSSSISRPDHQVRKFCMIWL